VEFQHFVKGEILDDFKIWRDQGQVAEYKLVRDNIAAELISDRSCCRMDAARYDLEKG
jgi:hypothetical protein